MLSRARGVSWEQSGDKEELAGSLFAGWRLLCNSRFSPVLWSKLKIVTVHWIKSRIWNLIDEWYINNIAKNQVFAIFHSRVICRSVSPKFIELCMETPCLCPSEGHKYGGRKVTKTSVTEFCYWNEKLLLKRSHTLQKMLPLEQALFSLQKLKR